MRSHWIQSGILAAALLAPLALNTPAVQAAAAAASEDARVIVKYRADSSLARMQALSAEARPAAQAEALGQRLGLTLRAGHATGERSHVVMAAGLSSQQLAARLSAESDIEYAVADRRMHIVAAPNDPFYASRVVGATSGGPAVGQWYLKPPGAAGTAANTAPAAINAEQAWDTTTGSASIVVAVLDTGVRFDHVDLKGGNVLPGYDMVSADKDGSFTSANDGNGRDADASDPGDWVTSAEAGNSSSPLYQCTVDNSSWHGTQTLGLIGAATNNGLGIASIGRSVSVMPVRVLGKCGGYESDITAGMLWAAGIDVAGVPHNANKARVLNMSLGGSGGCDAAYADAVSQVTAAGAVIVVAAGNGNGHVVGAPANCNGVVTAAGLRHIGDKVGYSDIGPEVTLAAPAGNCVNTASGSACLYPIMTTTNSGTTTPVTDAAGGSIYSDSFNASLGTSFSAPLVAGAAALMLSANPALTPADVKSRLAATARPFPTTGGTAGIPQCVAPTSSSADQDECYCVTGVCGSGMLDIHAAVLAAVATGAQAQIAVTTTTPTATQAVALSGSSSVASGGHNLTTYQWAIVNGGGIVTGFVNGTSTGPAVSVLPSAAGTFTVSLTVTDDAGVSATTSSTVTVAAAPVVVIPPASAPATSSSGGGGAIGAGWLALLLMAVLALVAVNRRDVMRRLRLAVSAPASRRG